MKKNYSDSVVLLSFGLFFTFLWGRCDHAFCPILLLFKTALGLGLIVFGILNWGKPEIEHKQEQGVIAKGQVVLLACPHCGTNTLKSKDRCLSCGKEI